MRYAAKVNNHRDVHTSVTMLHLQSLCDFKVQTMLAVPQTIIMLVFNDQSFIVFLVLA